MDQEIQWFEDLSNQYLDTLPTIGETCERVSEGLPKHERKIVNSMLEDYLNKEVDILEVKSTLAKLCNGLYPLQRLCYHIKKEKTDKKDAGTILQITRSTLDVQTWKRVEVLIEKTRNKRHYDKTQFMQALIAIISEPTWRTIAGKCTTREKPPEKPKVVFPLLTSGVAEKRKRETEETTEDQKRPRAQDSMCESGAAAALLALAAT